MSQSSSALENKKLFLLDMDGTIYLGNRLFDGTRDFLSHVKESGGRYMFLTNNSSKSVASYVEKLASLGVPAEPEDFFTSTDATIADFQNKDYRKIYALGTASFKEQLRAAGLPVTDKREAGIDCLLMGFDTELSFQKLEDACILLLDSKIDYVATNPDWVCPTSFGYVPDCGSIAEILERASGRRPRFIGKPEPDMILQAMKKIGAAKEETVIIGDRIYTDIMSGRNAGVDQIFVLSGEGTREDIAKYGVTPTYVMESIRELYGILAQNEDRSRISQRMA